MKFVLDCRVIPVGVVPEKTFFVKGDLCLGSSFAKKILNIKGIQGVFLGQDFITVTKLPSEDWNTLQEIVMEIIGQYIKEEKSFIDNKPYIANSNDNYQDSSIVKQIKALVEERVRPAVAQDGGDIVFHSFEDGVVYLKLFGACSGCPSSTATLKIGIENLLKYYVPEVKEVKQIIG